jgi:hypothetical protein
MRSLFKDTELRLISGPLDPSLVLFSTYHDPSARTLSPLHGHTFTTHSLKSTGVMLALTNSMVYSMCL